MIQYSNAKKALFTGTFLSLVVSVAASVAAVRFLYRFDSYLDCYYTRVFLAETAVLFPFCFVFCYLVFLLIFASAVLPFDHSDPKRMLNRVLFSVWLFLVFSLVGFFFLIPAANQVKERAAFRSSVAVDSLNKMTEMVREKRYHEALNFLGIYESVDKNADARFSSVDDTITFVFIHRRKPAVSRKEYWLNSENVRNELNSLIREQSPPAVRTAGNDYALKKLAYEKYSFGKENQYYQPIAESYKIFSYLSAISPEDDELDLHMKRAEKEIRRHVLVRDRIREESVFPLSHNICFVNIENETLRQVIYARKLISLTGRNLVESVRVETVYGDGRKSVLAAEYGRVEKDRILFDSVYLADPTKVVGGYFTEGGPDEFVNSHFVPLYLPGALLPLFDADNRNLATVPFFDLIKIRDRFPSERDIAGLYEQEIVLRSIRLLCIILAPFLILYWGFRTAPKDKNQYSGMGYQLPLVIPAVCFLLFAAYLLVGLVATAGVMFFSAKTILIALPGVLVGMLVCLISVFVVSYNRRMM